MSNEDGGESSAAVTKAEFNELLIAMKAIQWNIWNVNFVVAQTTSSVSQLCEQVH